MKFDWEKFWEDHPKKERTSVLWRNLRTTGYSYEKAFENLSSLLKFDKKDSVLDVGCGSGEMMNVVRPFVKSVYGVDWSVSMLADANSRYRDMVFLHSPAHRLNFFDGRFQKVYSLGVVQYIPYELFEPSFAEMLRVTSVGGKCLFGDVLFQAPKDAEVYEYPESVWKSMFEKYKGMLGLKSMTISESYFEKRPNILIER